MSNSTDTLKIMFVEEFEKAFGKPKADGIRENVMMTTLVFGESDFLAKWIIQEFVQKLNVSTPFADVELLSLVADDPEENEYGNLTRFVTVEFLVDEVTHKRFFPQHQGV
jgi:hypothetical protein